MLRPALRLCAVLSALILLSLAAPPLFAQVSGGVVASFTGSLSSAGQEDRIGFEVDTDHYNLNSRGAVDLIFLLSAEQSAQAPLDPGLISIESKEGGNVKVDTRKPDTADSTASIALASLTPGKYEIVVRSEHKTTGGYRLDVFLAGDANGDFKVDAADLQLIASLSGTKSSDPNYSPYADVDRNGVINGGDRQRADANLGAVAVPPQAENPLDQNLPEGALALVGASPDTFVSRNGLRFGLNGAEFDTTAASEFVLTINGLRVPASSLVTTAHLLTANVTLVDGRNNVSLKAYDTVGRPLYLTATLWAGSYTFQVNLVNPDGTPFTTQTSVVAALTDDPSVSEQAITTTGTVSFQNFPGRTILIKAKGIGNEIGTAGVLGYQGNVTIKMFGFNAPSSVDNNDFSLGTAGWTIPSGTPVWIVPHEEVISGFSSQGPVSTMAIGPGSIVDQDLMLGTSGQGERSISRTFTTAADTTAVKIRYRFITSEVPGGYCGSQWNDYFRVSIRSQLGGGNAGEANSMNGLGCGAFNGAGETNWREVILPVDKSGDTIQVDAGVANVGDALYDSQVVIDFVEEIKDQVRPQLAWNNTAGGLDLSWQVLNTALNNDVTINVYFASGPGYNNRLGTPVFSYTVPAGTQPGAGGPVHIDGTTLADDPAGTTYLIAASSPSQVASLRDVQIGYGPNADAGVVWASMIDTLKDGLRAAGQSQGAISSTARTPADQARAMFNNCLNHGAASQLAIYAAAGDAVINVYVNMTAGMTTAQIQANATTIRAAMEAEINAQGPSNVSHHCADPATRCVVDFSYDIFNASNRPLFVASVQGRVSTMLVEPSNHCYHLELG